MTFSCSMPASLQSDRKISSSVKTSASVETRISTAQHRTRLGAASTSGRPLPYSDKQDVLENNHGLSFATFGFPWSFAPQPGLDSYGAMPRIPRLRWITFLVFMSYGVFSVFFLSRCLYDATSAAEVTPPITSIRSSSLLQGLPNAHLSTKLTSIYPPPVLIQPFLLRAPVFDDSVTACLWIWDADVDLLPVWGSRWKSVISILVVSRHAPQSPAAQSLVSRLQDLRKVSSLKSKVSVHVLYLATDSPENPNAYLNLARIFSETASVTLFPGNLTAVPPKTFFRTVTSVANSSKPVIFSTRQRTMYPWSSLSPVLLRRDDPLWCTERFFPPLSRSADWMECLWQVWLETFGDVDTKPTTDWVQEPRPLSNLSTAQIKMRRRLSTKYHGETCILATRQLAASRAVNHGIDAKKGRWLKRHCRVGRD